MPKIAISAMHVCRHFVFMRSHDIFLVTSQSDFVSLHHNACAHLLLQFWHCKNTISGQKSFLIQMNNKQSMWHYKSLHIVMFYHFLSFLRFIKRCQMYCHMQQVKPNVIHIGNSKFQIYCHRCIVYIT